MPFSLFQGQSGEALFEASAGAGGLMELESFQELLKERSGGGAGAVTEQRSVAERRRIIEDLAPAAPLERLFVSVAGAS